MAHERGLALVAAALLTTACSGSTAAPVDGNGRGVEAGSPPVDPPDAQLPKTPPDGGSDAGPDAAADSGCVRQAAVFADGTFADTDWTQSSVVFAKAGTGTNAFQATQQLTDGNPDARRLLRLGGLGTTADFSQAASGVLFYNTAKWSPATRGPIATVDVKLDARFALGNIAMDVGIVIQQSGSLFFLVLGTVSPSSPGPWESYAKTGLGAASFVSKQNPVTTPDFSASGAPLSFGYSGYSVASGIGTNIVSASFDNWSVTIHPSPCP